MSPEVSAPERTDRVDDVSDVIIAKAGVDRQAQHLAESMVRDGIRPTIEVSEKSELVQRNKVNAGSDTQGAETLVCLVSREPGPLGIETDEIEVPRVSGAWGRLRQTKSREAVELL